MADSQQVLSTPTIERVWHTLKRRMLSVQAIESITPQMLRIIFYSDDLVDFVSLAPDDHIKLFFPVAPDKVESRDYTPRHYDKDRGVLSIDFMLHERGVANDWAASARVGDMLEIGGPRGSSVISGSVGSWLLVGDETAIPAIGRRIEEAGPGQRITAVMAITDTAEQQRFNSSAEVVCHWVYRPLQRADDPSFLMEAVSGLPLQPDTFVWLAAEATVTRTLRAYFKQKRQVQSQWLKAMGYWVKGAANSHEKFN